MTLSLHHHLSATALPPRGFFPSTGGDSPVGNRGYPARRVSITGDVHDLSRGFGEWLVWEWSSNKTQWKRKSVVTLTLTILTSSQAILIVWSKRAGKYEYSVTTANFLVESLKCTLSLAALAKIWQAEGITKDNSTLPCEESAPILHICLCGCSRISDTEEFNIISTGVLYRIILKRRLSEIQWVAFVLLCAGCTTAQLNSNSDQVLQTPVQGWVMVINWFAGDGSSQWLYVFGMAFNLVAILVQDFDAINKGFFHGYSFITVLMIVNHALRYATEPLLV
ncbi:hypothetical protein Droror1_Dr00019720 [Drosera rotundifolia]